MAERSQGFEDQGGAAFISIQKCEEVSVWAYCEAADCRGVASLDLTRWPHLARLADDLTSLEVHMRCICGAMQVRLSRLRPHATCRRVTIYPFS